MEQELSVSDIDAQIEALRILKRKIQSENRPPRTPRTPKKTVVRHTRKVRCSLCGTEAPRSELQQVARYEYQHLICPVKETKVIRIDFQL